MKKSIIFTALCLLTLFVACDKSDNMTTIFIGKVWRMNYIAQGSIGKTWYQFEDVTNQNIQDYAGRTKVFTLSLSGLQRGDEITGTFSGTGSLAVTGKWTASSSDDRVFKTKDTSGSTADNTDIIAQKILYGLQNAKSWKGDQYNLYIYFNYQGESLFMAFSPQQ